MAVLEALSQARNFTKTEKDIAAYILNHADEVVSMSIGELAGAAFVSSASIVRLCHKMGVDGYREFRISLAADLERARSDETDINPDTPFLEGQGTRDIMNSIAALKHQAIDQSYAMVPAHAIQKAARLVLGARRVALFAIGDSEISCESFSNLLLKIGIMCYNANRHGDSLAVSTGLGPQDLAILVSYSGSLTGEMSTQLRLLKEHRCKLIVISSDQDIPDRVAGLDCFVALPSGESLHGKIATFFAQTCIRYVLDSIYGECFARNYQDNITRIEHFDKQRSASR
ncbi:MAG: MurR/RpiR family transcriptional regulator [Atopobiaceae bacterium]|nr:MurR/RpiR family transcriptional regulator [Atopobiaceae bacterium]